MDKNDVEMEDPEKQDQDSGNNAERSETKVLDTKTESKGEEFPSAVNVAGDANKSENGSEDLNKLTNDAINKINGGSEMEVQMKPESETSELMNVEGSTGEQIETKSKNEEVTTTQANPEEQTADRSTVDKQTDVRNEVVEQNSTNGGVREENSTENGVEGGSLVKNVEENPSSDAAGEKPKDTGKEDGDPGEHAARSEMNNENVDTGNDPRENRQFPTELSSNDAPQSQNAKLDEVPAEDAEMEDTANWNEDKAVNGEPKEHVKEITAGPVSDGNAKTTETANQHEVETATKHETDGSSLPNQHEVEIATKHEAGGSSLPNQHDVETAAKHEAGSSSLPNQLGVETATKHEGDSFSVPNQHEAATPNSLVRDSSVKAGDHSGETVKTVFTQATLPLMAEDDDGTPEDQAAFMKELENFHREKAMDFKAPKFYGQPLNCLKLWRAVIRLGGYDRVTGSKLWRQVGESFHPPKTCTTVSWTFRIFYEKSLLEYEKHKRQSGELQLPVVTLPEASGADSEGNGWSSGAGRARRDAATRAMQGWHVQRLFGNGEVGEPVIKDKNLNNMAKQKNVKSIGSLKQKRPNEGEQSVKAARTESSKQLVTSVVDVGPPADWVKINIRQTKDCFEVYALVPGLLREEVRVQSDPAGRLVITGQPEQVDNPWGITPFKKVVSLPARIDPLQTSAVVSLHGRLFVRVPFEQSNA